MGQTPPYEGVDLGGLDVIELAHSVLDLSLVGPPVHNEHLHQHPRFEHQLACPSFSLPVTSLLWCHHVCRTKLTKVLLSSIFFMADSVVKGYFTTAKLSSFGGLGALQQSAESDMLSGDWSSSLAEPAEQRTPTSI